MLLRRTRGLGDGVGEPVAAAHPDDLAITYSLSGADASLFSVDEETGQIMVREGVELALGTTYSVNLTATDSAGFGAIVIVMIEVTEASFSPYDLNGNDAIERDEVIMAIRDYFDGGHHEGRRDRAHQAVLRGVTGMGWSVCRYGTVHTGIGRAVVVVEAGQTGRGGVVVDRGWCCRQSCG